MNLLKKVRKNLLELIRVVKRKLNYSWKDVNREFAKLNIKLPLHKSTSHPVSLKENPFQLEDKDFIHK